MPIKRLKVDLEKGERILSDGAALIDTSGRTRELKERSVLAIATKKVGYTILLNSSEKKKIFNKLLKTKKTSEDSKAIIHSVKLYFALKDYLITLPAFYICSDGFNPGLLKHHLKRLMGIKYHEDKIKILPSLKPLFGKKNIADRLAYEVNKGKTKPNFILKEKHFKQLSLL
jgi:hypothetical protein